jgi:DNA-binding NarL/FixJ family response regulator
VGHLWRSRDACETIQRTKRLSPDVLLLDVTTPDLGTEKGIAQIFETCPAVRIVALASRDSAELAAKALAAGVRSKVGKCFRMTEAITVGA